MPDDPVSSDAVARDLPTPRKVRLVLTVVLDPDHTRGDCHWHVRDVTTGELLTSASWPAMRDQFNDVWLSTRLQKALSDVWTFAGPF